MKKGIEKMSDLEIVKALWGIYCEGKKTRTITQREIAEAINLQVNSMCRIFSTALNSPEKVKLGFETRQKSINYLVSNGL